MKTRTKSAKRRNYREQDKENKLVDQIINPPKKIKSKSTSKNNIASLSQLREDLKENIPLSEDLFHMDYFTALKSKKEFKSSKNDKTNKLEFELLDYNEVIKHLPRMALGDQAFEVNL